MHPPFHTHDYLTDRRIRHGFFGRKGGVSEGLYRGLNCGPGSHDNKAHIVENRARVAHALDTEPEKLVTLYQVHSPNAIIVHEPWESNPPQADAMVTNVPGIALGILTADCAPVLFADEKAGVIGAAHAGWKGAVTGVIESTLAAMEKLGSDRENIAAVIGPTIAQASYEVGPEFIERFTPADIAQFFIPSKRERHFMFDLPSYVAQTARRAGLQRIAILAMDTMNNEHHYFSYRRATINREPDYGRQISAIGLRA